MKFLSCLGIQKQTRYRTEGKNGGGDPRDPNRTSHTTQAGKFLDKDLLINQRSIIFRLC